MTDVAIMGHGVVGSGVAEVLIRNADTISAKIGQEINIKYILDLRDFDGLSYSDKFTKNFDDILSDSSVKVVAEVMGGVHPAYDFVKALLENGKSVVTSNKELVAAKGDELLKIAKAHNVNFLFEASVGGGIPILQPISDCLAANNIKEVYGILNGTTNFILNKMVKENASFEAALKNAQELGYAEKNPDSDILGLDAGRKVCILAALCFGRHVYPEQVDTKGITGITLDDVDYADKLGFVIKLIGRAARLENGKITASVHPTLVPRSNMMSSVDGVYNAVTVIGDACDDLMFYGKGAGKLPTASAVVSDIIECVKNTEKRKNIYWESAKEEYVEKWENVPTRLYIRLSHANAQDIRNVFGNDIPLLYNGVTKEAVFITEPDTERALNEKLNKLSSAKTEAILYSM